MLKICFFFVFAFVASLFRLAPSRLCFTMAQAVKHCFLLFQQYTLTKHSVIDVNFDLNISIEGSAWHGYADYTVVNGEGQWELTYHWNGNVKKCRTVVYKQVPNTTSFLDSNQKHPAYNGLLIPRIADCGASTSEGDLEQVYLQR